MFALWFNLVCALAYGIATLLLGAEMPTLICWIGGAHAGMAFSLAAYLWVNREGA